MPTYISENIGFSLSSSLAFNALGLASFVFLIPVMGLLSDKVGRKPLLVGAALGFVVLTYPIFLLLSQATVISVIFALLAIALLLAVFSGPGPAALVELFPTSIRYSAIGVGYNLSVTIFGGTAPFIATLLTSRTGSALSPSYYAIFTALITLVAVVSMRESYKAPLK
jgi:MHS family proline/betaine transporter-like MFS transporter